MFGSSRVLANAGDDRNAIPPWNPAHTDWAAANPDQPLGTKIGNHVPRIGPGYGYPGVHKTSIWTLPMACGDGKMPWKDMGGGQVHEVFPGMGRSKAYPWKKEVPRLDYTPLGRPEHRAPPRAPTPDSADIGTRRFKVGLKGGGASWDGAFNLYFPPNRMEFP